jgi:hypothetical protein
MTSLISDVTPMQWALMTLSAGTVFTIFWILDALTHKELVKVDITDRELQTHRNILAASMLMELSLVLMYWSPWLMLPLFIAFFITRLVHEFIDELHFHTDRCSKYESTLHLGMWISVLSKTGAMFMWGFFTQFDGVLELPMYMYVWGGIIFLTMGYVSFVEYRR